MRRTELVSEIGRMAVIPIPGTNALMSEGTEGNGYRQKSMHIVLDKSVSQQIGFPQGRIENFDKGGKILDQF